MGVLALLKFSTAIISELHVRCNLARLNVTLLLLQCRLRWSDDLRHLSLDCPVVVQELVIALSIAYARLSAVISRWDATTAFEAITGQCESHTRFDPSNVAPSELMSLIEQFQFSCLV